MAKRKTIDLKHNNYVADIGFTLKKDAKSGGGILSSKTMKIMGDIGMDIYFSEYSDTI